MTAAARPPAPTCRTPTLLADAPRVREALDGAGWSAAALDDLLGATARTHLDRDELAPLLRRTRDGSPLETLARLFVPASPVELDEDAERAGVPETWLRPGRLRRHAPGAAAAGACTTASRSLVPHDAGRAATGVHPRPGARRRRGQPDPGRRHARATPSAARSTSAPAAASRRCSPRTTATPSSPPTATRAPSPSPGWRRR